MSKVLGLFDDQGAAENAISNLKDLGVSEDRISLLAKDENNEDVEISEDMNMGQNLVDGSAAGGALGGITGILAGTGLLAIPGLGPVLAAGPIAAGLTGAAAGGLTGGLVDYGIDQRQGERYAGELENGKILVGVEDTDENLVNDVAAKLKELGANDVAVH